MPAMSIHIAIERYLFQRCKQWPFILHLSDVSPKDASNDHSFCNRATISLSSKDPINDHFAIEPSLAQRRKQWLFCHRAISLQRCEEFATELSLFPRMRRIPNLCFFFFFYFFSSSFCRCSWCCSGGAIGNGLPRRGAVDSLTISRIPLLFPLELP